MALNASQIIGYACAKAHAEGFTAQAADYLNIILQNLCQVTDLDTTRGTFNFTFNTALQATANYPNITPGGGPYPLPYDFLRMIDDKDAMWFLQGVPYPMIPCDLSEYDNLIQQAGNTAYPYIFATDMSPQVPPSVPTITGTISGNAITALSQDPTLVGWGVGSHLTGTGLYTGSNSGNAPGAYITSISSTAIGLNTSSNTAGVGVSITAGPPSPNMVVWPPPSGNFQAMIRYRRQMPDIATPATSAAVPWFPSQAYLMKQLTAMLMEDTADPRAAEWFGAAEGLLRPYLINKDDSTDRAKTVKLDRRRFGSQFTTLKNTKVVGW